MFQTTNQHDDFFRTTIHQHARTSYHYSPEFPFHPWNQWNELPFAVRRVLRWVPTGRNEDEVSLRRSSQRDQAFGW